MAWSVLLLLLPLPRPALPLLPVLPSTSTSSPAASSRSSDSRSRRLAVVSWTAGQEFSAGSDPGHTACRGALLGEGAQDSLDPDSAVAPREERRHIQVSVREIGLEGEAPVREDLCCPETPVDDPPDEVQDIIEMLFARTGGLHELHQVLNLRIQLWIPGSGVQDLKHVTSAASVDSIRSRSQGDGGGGGGGGLFFQSPEDVILWRRRRRRRGGRVLEVGRMKMMMVMVMSVRLGGGELGDVPMSRPPRTQFRCPGGIHRSIHCRREISS